MVYLIIFVGHHICDREQNRLPTMCHFGMWIVLSERQSRLSRFKKNFYLSLNYHKQFRYGAWPRNRAITRDNFLCEWPIYMAEQTANYQTSALLLHLLFCESPCSPLKPQAPCPFLSSGWHRSLNCLTCPWVLYFYGTLRGMKLNICFSPINLSSANLIIRSAKELRRVE